MSCAPFFLSDDATTDNAIGDDGAACFGAALRENTSLVKLTLGSKAAVRWLLGRAVCVQATS